MRDGKIGKQWKKQGTVMPESIQEKGFFSEVAAQQCAAAIASVLGARTDTVMFRGHLLQV